MSRETEEEAVERVMSLYGAHADWYAHSPYAMGQRLKSLREAIENRVHHEMAVARQDGWANESLEDVKRKRIDGV